MTYDDRERSQDDGAPVECYRFLRGADTWLLTSADVAITLPTGTYAAAPISRAETADSQEDDAGALEITLPRTHELAQLFVAFVPTTQLTVTLYRAHRGDESLAIVAWVGTAASARYEGAEATLSFVPLEGTLRRKVPGLAFQNLCNWALYGEGCGVSQVAFRDAAVVSAVGTSTVTATAFGARADGWFKNGWIEGPDGEVRFIVEHVGTVITLMNPFPALAIGAAVLAFAGCDRTMATCHTKFNNRVNHMGFPYIPTHNPHNGVS